MGDRTMTRKYFDMVSDMKLPGRWHLDDPVTDEDPEPWPYTAGKRLISRYRPVVAVQVPGAPIDFTLTPFIVPIVSSRLADLISRHAGDDVQMIPARVGRWDGYYVMNLLRTVRCIDESRSDFRKWTEADGRPDKIGKYRAVDLLRVDVSQIESTTHIFRLEGWKWPIIVSEEVADAIRRGNFIGPVFQDVT
jgi:hypothetical protein